MEQADVSDLKSGGRNTVWVRIPSPALIKIRRKIYAPEKSEPSEQHPGRAEFVEY